MCHFQAAFNKNISNILVIFAIFVDELGHKIPHFTNDAIYIKYCTKYGHFFDWATTQLSCVL